MSLSFELNLTVMLYWLYNSLINDLDTDPFVMLSWTSKKTRTYVMNEVMPEVRKVRNSLFTSLNLVRNQISYYMPHPQGESSRVLTIHEDIIKENRLASLFKCLTLEKGRYLSPHVEIFFKMSYSSVKGSGFCTDKTILFKVRPDKSDSETSCEMIEQENWGEELMCTTFEQMLELLGRFHTLQWTGHDGPHDL